MRTALFVPMLALAVLESGDLAGQREESAAAVTDAARRTVEV
jgi:hypothetical protein